MFRPSCRNRFSSEPVDAAQDVSEQASRDCDLGHLEGYIAPVADDLAANLDQFVSQTGQRPVPHGIRQGQGSQEVAEVVGECVKLETDSIVSELAVVSRSWWKFSGVDLRADDCWPFQAARSSVAGWIG